ncbi:MAG TPA: ATP-binding protein [Chitinophagaceae bacterium]
MKVNSSARTRINRFQFRGLSIQQRLPILICILLLCVIIIFSWTSYVGVKRATLKVGQDRLYALTEQLCSMFGQSSQNYLIAARTMAGQDSIKKFLRSEGKDSGSASASLEIMQKLQKDSSTLLVELLDANKTLKLRSARPGIEVKVNLDSVLNDLSIGQDASKIGKIYLSGDSMYYPVVASITDEKQVIGYVIRWRLLSATPKAIEQFSKLIGTNATLNIGNNDGSLWTDLVKPIPNPPLDIRYKGLFEYSPPKGSRAIAVAQPIPNTPWLVLVVFPRKTVLEASTHFLNSILLIGGALIAIGILLAWLMSRNITRPLNKLTAAASAIAGGDYSSLVQVDRNDELGKLARAFNTMSIQVHNAQLDLEKKVKERTAQLEAANKELEAFSYSVSHDLRAPLRALSGYGMMLKEDYGPKLDDEANRITDRIVSNAKMMGKLIDDLISFSQMGVKEVVHQTVDMKKVAEDCMAELLHHETPDKYQVHINNLPACHGDSNLIKQVWMNLISNAIKYSSKKPVPCIEIGCTEDAYTNTYFIRDNGVGFDMQHAHKLFGVFQRLHSHKVFEGTGIGLAFVKRIMLKHNGEIRAVSSIDEGATFYFTLPASRKNLFAKTG